MNGKEELLTIMEICARAKEAGLYDEGTLEHMMDIEYANEQCKLDLKSWLNADDANFAHDFIGIYNNFNRQTKQMDNFFVPRFARGE